MKIALGIEYCGSDYFGWQKQQSVISVQEELEKALSSVACEQIEVFCAGRTDSGVHATGQVVHFETKAIRPLKAWIFGTNARMPKNIKVTWAKEVNDDFHARFSAISRRYIYIINNQKIPSAILNGAFTHIKTPLDEKKMHQAAQYLLGEQDFSSFRAAQCQSNTPFRNVHFVKVTRKGHLVKIEICANAFLHHMVRNIVGSLIKVGIGEQSEEWIKYLLEQKNRSLAAPTAPADGLYLVAANYPDEFEIPQNETFLEWI